MDYNRSVITDAEFGRASDSALDDLNRRMDTIADEHDVEILFQSGVLSLEIEEPTFSKIIISPNSSARQIWISAQLTSFKLDWSAEREAFVLSATEEPLDILVGRLVGEELGVGPVQL